MPVSTPTANQLTADILIEIPKEFPVRIWRSNAGGGIPVSRVKAAIAAIRAGQYKLAVAHLTTRVVKFGVPGQADISGIIMLTSRVEFKDYDNAFGVRLEIEVKAGDDQQSEEQKSFEAMITEFGGIYIVARSLDGVREALRRL